MVRYIQSRHELSYSSLQQVYADSVTARAQEMCADDWKTEGIRLAQQELYQYFDAFFSDGKSFCALLAQENEYVSILRMEPYKEGWLLAGLETAPNYRNRGNASKLVKAVLDNCKARGLDPVYSHVYKNNPVSLRLHLSLDFTVITNSAKFLDGSFSTDAYTLMWTNK